LRPIANQPSNPALGSHKAFNDLAGGNPMAVSLPYLASNKNVPALFAKIQSAKVPERFSQDFLKTTIGLKGSNDRPLIPLLRALGFLDQSGAPTQAYRSLKNGGSAKAAIGKAVRTAYAPLFAADENSHKLPLDKLKGLIAQVAGTDDGMTARIASTFTALAKLGDLGLSAESDVTERDGAGGMPTEEQETDKQPAGGGGPAKRQMQSSFHYNIQVHLPSNGTEEVYLNIFNALRKTFQ
jgi:hypothetical protein